VAAAGAVVLLLGAVGSVLAPSWQRPRLAADRGFGVPPQSRPAPALPDSGPVRREDLRVPVAGTTLPVTVLTPAGSGSERRPAVVFVHGAGPATRKGLIHHAERVARAGIVALVYDKRRVGYSPLHRDYRQLADDALAMVRVLRSRSDVDPDRVGLWGISEGGWVVPLAASRSPEVGFAILVAAPMMSPGSQAVWAADEGLRRQGAPDGARRFLSRALAMGNLDYVNYDGRPALARMRQPVLGLYPAADRAAPPAESARILVDVLEGAGNRSHAVRFFPDADHGMRVNGKLAPGYLETMVWWIKGLPGTGTPPSGQRVTGGAPEQEYAAEPAPPTPWYGTGPALAAVFALIGAGYLAGPAASVARRWRRRHSPPEPVSEPWRRVRRRQRAMTAAGIGTAVGVNVAIGTLVALAFAGAPTGASQGVWAALRLAGVGTAVLAAAAGVTAAGAVREGWRPDGAAVVSMTGAFGATSLVLLLGAYWDLFAPRW
jgi:dienelactone hydrolase